MRKVNRQQLITDTKEFFEKDFPKELMADIFNLYYKQSTKLEYEERGDKNQFRYKVLDNVIDPIGRMISEGSNVKSMIMTRAMVQYFSMLMAYQKQVDPEEFEEMKQCMQGKGKGPKGEQSEDQQEGEGDGDGEEQDGQGQPQSGKGKSNKKPMTPEEALEKLLKNDRIETLQEEILNEAKEAIDGISEVLDENEQEAIWQQDDPNLQFSKESINAMLQEYLSMKMNMNKVRDIIKRLLDKSVNYFSGKEKPYYENMFEASSIDGLEDYHLLHPKLRKLFVEDIMVKDKIFEGKINLYIDASGSMNAHIKYDGQVISGADFAKSFAMQMVQMNLVNRIFWFDTSIVEIPVSQIGISSIPSGGGTSINVVAQHIEANNTNAIVVTDACDYCSVYSSYAYYIGIAGARFTSFEREACKKYADGRQIVEFDGSVIHNIDETGNRERR